MRIICFNPRAHGGRDLAYLTHLLGIECFNPRAHGGRDYSTPSTDEQGTVSIHAPTGGATNRENA